MTPNQIHLRPSRLHNQVHCDVRRPAENVVAIAASDPVQLPDIVSDNIFWFTQPSSIRHCKPSTTQQAEVVSRAADGGIVQQSQNFT